MAGRLHVIGGRLKGPASITYNHPWPCPNGQWGMRIPHGVRGVVMHTMVGNLPGTISVFNNPGYQASAHFGIDQNGHIHQFGPVNGWVAWAEEAGNENWYSIEHADNGNPNNPLTDAQVTASARVVEALSGFASFPLRVANSTSQRGGLERAARMNMSMGVKHTPELKESVVDPATGKKRIDTIFKFPTTRTPQENYAQAFADTLANESVIIEAARSA